MVRDFDHLCPDLLAHAGNIWDQPILLCDVGCVEPANVLPNTAHGDVGLLSEGVLKNQIELMQIFKGIMPYLGIVIFCMVMMYQFPGLALWFPDYLFGKWVP